MTGVQNRPRVHWLKVDKRFWDALASGQRTFDVRRNDRKFRVGDELKLSCYDSSFGYCGQRLTRIVAYVMYGEDCPGIDCGYVVLGLRDDT